MTTRAAALAGVRLHPTVGDVLLAAALGVAAFTSLDSHQGPTGWLYVIAGVGTVSLVARRQFPIPVLAVTVAITTFVAVNYENSWWPFAALIALYSVAAHCVRKTSVAAVAVSLVVLGLAIASEIDWQPLGWNDIAQLTGRLAPLAAAWVLGDNIRTRRAYVSAVEERASQLERERDSNARRAAAEEQARIAREVHDVVAHNLSVIIVQATAADAVFSSDPADAQRAVRTIGTTARSALDELRRVLGVVRVDEQRSTALSPQPNLARLASLLEQVRAAGLDVELELSGDQRELPAALELSAYRIVQEALTNTLRHAGASHAAVHVRFDPDVLEVEIVDDGVVPVSANGASGRGLIGMRERAATFGGSVEAGPGASGGFRVAARIPLAPAAR
jgi:signal transduction histidine kinase